MINENVNFDENDEVTDEQYYSEDNDMNETIQTANNSSEDSYEESKIDEEIATGAESANSDFDDNEYKVQHITENFLKWECSIKNEQSKTVIRFKYRGDEFKGVVLQKLNAMNYVFLVKPVGKGIKKTVEKVMKKIYIPDAELVWFLFG